MKEILRVTALVVLISIAIWSYISFVEITGQNKCFERFGNGWNFRLQTYAASICVNNKGEVKYL